MENPLSQIRAQTSRLIDRLPFSAALTTTPADKKPETFFEAVELGTEQGTRIRVNRMARQLHHHQAPKLHQTIAEMSAELGIEKPEIWVPDHRLVIQRGGKTNEVMNAISLENNCAALALGKPRMVLGGNFMKMMTGDASGRIINDEMKAVIAHEMGHLKYDRGFTNGLLLGPMAPYAMPIAAVSGLAIYNFLNKNPEHKRNVEDQMQIDPETGDRHFHTQVGQYSSPMHSITKYLVAGLLGYGAGMLTWRHMNRMVEFRADRTSAELMGSGKPLIQAFEKVRAESMKCI